MNTTDAERQSLTKAGKATDADLPALIGRLAAQLATSHYPNADRASLKRYAVGQPPPLAFYRLWLRHLGTELPVERQTSAWTLLAWGLALMGAGAHRPGRGLGRALAETGYAEARLERLLTADDDTRQRLFASLVRFLAAKGESFDWLDAGRLLLTRNFDAHEALNRRIATDYYRHLPRQDKD